MKFFIKKTFNLKIILFITNICNLIEDKNHLNCGLGQLLNKHSFDKYKDIIFELRKYKPKRGIEIAENQKIKKCLIKLLISKM